MKKIVSLMSVVGVALLLFGGCVTRPYVYSKAIGEIADIKGASPAEQIAGITQVTGDASAADAAQARRPVVVTGHGFGGGQVVVFRSSVGGCR